MINKQLNVFTKVIWFISTSTIYMSSGYSILVSCTFGIIFIYWIEKKLEWVYINAFILVGGLFIILWAGLLFLFGEVIFNIEFIGFIFRMLIVGFAAIILFSTVSYYDIVDFLTAIRLPRIAILAISIGFRTLPMLIEESQRIMLAQRARGLGSKRGISRILEVPIILKSLLIPLIVSSFHRAETIQIVLSLREVSIETQEKPKSIKSFSSADIILLLLSISNILIISYYD